MLGFKFLQRCKLDLRSSGIYTAFVCLFVCFWRNSPQWARAFSFTRFLDQTQRRTTVGRTPLDEWSARRRDLYLTTHNTHNRQTSMPPVGFEPTILAAADLRHRSRGHWDRITQLSLILTYPTFRGNLSGPIFEDFLILEDGTHRLSRNFGNYQQTLCNIRKERISQVVLIKSK